MLEQNQELLAEIAGEKGSRPSPAVSFNRIPDTINITLFPHEGTHKTSQYHILTSYGIA